jgi:hypothetical protein
VAYHRPVRQGPRAFQGPRVPGPCRDSRTIRLDASRHPISGSQLETMAISGSWGTVRASSSATFASSRSRKQTQGAVISRWIAPFRSPLRCAGWRW